MSRHSFWTGRVHLLISLKDLYISFFKVGLTTFGGGYAVLPVMEREIVDNRHWVSEEELADYYAIGQITPGVIIVNTATFIGVKYRGIAGGIASTLGAITPSLIIICFLAGLISNFADFPAVQNAFAGIQACVCVLVFNALRKLYKKSVIDAFTFCIFLFVAVGSIFLDLSPVWFVIASGFLAVILKVLEVKKA